jgi:hypothetical protein
MDLADCGLPLEAIKTGIWGLSEFFIYQVHVCRHTSAWGDISCLIQVGGNRSVRHVLNWVSHVVRRIRGSGPVHARTVQET